MSKAPSLKSIQQVARKLFEDEHSQQRFIDSILHPTPKPTALVWIQQPEELETVEILPSPDFFPSWITLVSANSQPGKLPQHEQGKYYCLDASSVYAVAKTFELTKPSCVIDLCASPGGKSICVQRALKSDLLISNEVIGNRIPALLSNLKRCGFAGSFATQADPSHISATNSNTADLVLVDAPCSGQSLLAKAEKGLGCFSKPVINSNVGRQRRILAEASKIVRTGGHILYSTCTFSPEENEGNVKWFLKKFPEFEEISTGRMWPADGLGAGSFYSLLRCTRSSEEGGNDFDASSVKHWVIDCI